MSHPNFRRTLIRSNRIELTKLTERLNLLSQTLTRQEDGLEKLIYFLRVSVSRSPYFDFTVTDLLEQLTIVGK